jgi:signal transduction histidine kinase
MQSNESLQTSNRKKEALNAELEAFVYTVSHDLRAPLRAINGFAELLQSEIGPAIGAGEQAYLDNIKRNASRMALLLNDLLDLSKYSVVDIHRDTVDMNQMVREVVRELNIDTTRVDLQAAVLPPGSCDASLIRQVWSNLIANAVKYSARSSAPKVKISFTEGRYTVSDNGAGFDMAYRDKLFKLFSRLHADRDYEGTGVGLAIVKRVVERHEGAVYANSVLGSGSTFGFSLG